MESKINRIIDIVRQLREDGMGAGAVSGAPTNSLTSPTDGKGYIAGTKEAGDNPPVNLKNRKKNRYIYPPIKGYRSIWKPPQQ